MFWQPQKPCKQFNCQEKGGRAGSSYQLDAARSNQHKLVFHILDLPGGILLKAQEPSKLSFLLLVMKKDTHNDIFSRRLLKTNNSQITGQDYIFFQNLILSGWVPSLRRSGRRRGSAIGDGTVAAASERNRVGQRYQEARVAEGKRKYSRRAERLTCGWLPASTAPPPSPPPRRPLRAKTPPGNRASRSHI